MRREASGDYDKILHRISELHAKANQDEVVGRWAIGREIDKLMTAPAKYGKGAVQDVAEELGVKADTLYNAARLYRAWPSEECRDRMLDKQKGIDRQPLRLGHLQEIARLSNADDRERMVDWVITRGPTVREVKQKLAATRHGGAAEHPTATPGAQAGQAVSAPRKHAGNNDDACISCPSSEDPSEGTERDAIAPAVLRSLSRVRGACDAVEADCAGHVEAALQAAGDGGLDGAAAAETAARVRGAAGRLEELADQIESSTPAMA